jgi:hypothetical protein
VPASSNITRLRIQSDRDLLGDMDAKRGMAKLRTSGIRPAPVARILVLKPQAWQRRRRTVMPNNLTSAPAPGPHPSAAGLSAHDYELLLLAIETVADDARRALDAAAGEIEAWQTILRKVA